MNRLSEDLRIYIMIEGFQDEASFIPGIQWFITPAIMVNANTGIGVTSKAIDFAPEIGIMFSFLP